MKLANDENLKPVRTTSEARERGRNGGKASGEARRRKKTMREAAKSILDMPISGFPEFASRLKSMGITGDDITFQMAVMSTMMVKAMSGNVNAATFLRDTAGENPALMLRRDEFEYEKQRKSGQGVEIEDISEIVERIWGYDQWNALLNDGIPVLLTKKVKYRFADVHLEYIKKCQYNTYNILEGAVRSGKTVDHVLAFAKEICDTPDKFHLATGSTMANAKLNIGDANGFGLEHIFRGQCRWTSYKDNDALAIRGPYTNFKERIVIFAGGGSSNSFQKIRGNSYGMWIATEINLHHDNTIKEAFNRTIASHKRKIFWDLNPEHPKAAIYVKYIDKYKEKDEQGILKGGYNYAHMTLYDNINISDERREEIVSQYDKNSIWYIRDILGKRSIAEGLVYTQFASLAAQEENRMKISLAKAQEMRKTGELLGITIGVDFGGNGSGHSFVATAPTVGYGKLVALASELHKEELDPDALGKTFVNFVNKIINLFGGVSKIYCDSAEQVLIRGLKKAMVDDRKGDIKIGNAKKERINDRIFCFSSLVAQDRFLYTELCETLEDALSMAVWKPNTVELERLDDGTSDIDTLDGFEYSYERDMKNYIKTQVR